MREDVLKIIVLIFGIGGAMATFVYWHFKTVNGFKDEIHKLEMKYHDLQWNDKLRQNEIEKIAEAQNVFISQQKTKNQTYGKRARKL